MASSHPRVEARRAAVKRDRSRARRRLAAALLVVFTLAGAAWLAVQSSVLDLEKVEVRGSRRAGVEALRAAAEVELGEPLLLVDRGAVARRIERSPWVRKASVSFSLPGTLVVKVQERVPVAWIARGPGDDAGVALVDGDGRVVDHRGTPPERLLELALDVSVPGPGKQIRDAEGALAIAGSVPDGLRARVRAVTPARGGYVVSVDGIEIVRFGPAQNVTQKWDALEAVVASLGERTVYLVDVRVPSVPAVRERKDLPTTTTVPPADPADEPTPGVTAAPGED